MEVVNTAQIEYDVFNQLYEQSFRHWKSISVEGQEDRVGEAISLCAEAIPLTLDWVQKYKPHIQQLKSPIDKDFTNWMTMIEEIKIKLCSSRKLLSYQQTDRPLLEKADEIREDVDVLLKRHFHQH